MDSKLFKTLDNLISLLCVSLLAAMAIIVIASVFLRYIFSITYVWSEELITMLFIGASFFGCIMAVKEKGHIVVDVFLIGLSPKIRNLASIMASVANIFVQVILIEASITWIETTGGSPTPGMRLPSYIFYSFLPITSALTILYEMLIIKDGLSQKQGGESTNEHVDIVS